MTASKQEKPQNESSLQPDMVAAFVAAGDKLQAVVSKMQKIPPDGISSDEAEELNKTLLEAMNELNAETKKFLNNSWRQRS